MSIKDMVNLTIGGTFVCHRTMTVSCFTTTFKGKTPALAECPWTLQLLQKSKPVFLYDFSVSGENFLLLSTEITLWYTQFKANISANHEEATQCIYACRHGQDSLLKFNMSIKVEERGSTLNTAWCLVTGWSKWSKAADLPGFPWTSIKSGKW